MKISFLIKNQRLNKQLQNKYGVVILDSDRLIEMGWEEVVAILRFGREWKSDQNFIDELNNIKNINFKEILYIKKELLKGNIPIWIKIINKQIQN